METLGTSWAEQYMGPSTAWKERGLEGEGIIFSHKKTPKLLTVSGGGLQNFKDLPFTPDGSFGRILVTLVSGSSGGHSPATQGVFIKGQGGLLIGKGVLKGSHW